MDKYVDDREDQEMILLAQRLGYMVKRLPFGDYQMGNTVVERKSMDFIHSVGRMFSQLEEIRRAGLQGYLVVDLDITRVMNEVVERNLSRTDRKPVKGIRNTVYGIVASCSVRGFPPIFCNSKKHAMMVIDRILEKSNDGRDRSLEYNPFRDEPDDDDMCLRMLTGVKGMSVKRAKRIIDSPWWSSARVIRDSSPLPYIYECLDDYTLMANGIEGLNGVMLKMLRIAEGVYG